MTDQPAPGAASTQSAATAIATVVSIVGTAAVARFGLTVTPNTALMLVTGVGSAAAGVAHFLGGFLMKRAQAARTPAPVAPIAPTEIKK